jgi:glucose-6-phosphate isomerase
MSTPDLWRRFCEFHCACPELGISLDVAHMHFADDLFARQTETIRRARQAMTELEGGAIANPDEQRMVGHYWLRAPELAPDAELSAAITDCVTRIKKFAGEVHNGTIAPPGGGRFEDLLVIGIGGSALGPQLCDAALAQADSPMRAWFFDNTDPDGFDRTLAQLGSRLARTLVLVVSKSGGTKETRNGMLEAMHAFRQAGLDFARQAVAVTGAGSALDDIRHEQGWLTGFPMWDWVGGRTSQTAAVGLLPAALQGFDIDGLLAGAAAMDRATRLAEPPANPALMLALMWHDAAHGRGLRDMVVLPYKDRLGLLARYLQQLIMESLGKETDLDGKVVREGITVYGNKGSTDQHAYVQQLREGLHNFYALFVRVLGDRQGPSIEVEPGVTSGDFLHGFLLGTRAALADNGRESMTLTIERLDARGLGGLIALFERAVGFYAAMVNINAYHQPGVEAGKRAAGEIIVLAAKVRAAVTTGSDTARTAEQIAAEIGAADRVETVFQILMHEAHRSGGTIERHGAARPEAVQFGRRA